MFITRTNANFSEASIGLCGQLLLLAAYLFILLTFPFSLLVCIKVVLTFPSSLLVCMKVGNAVTSTLISSLIKTEGLISKDISDILTCTMSYLNDNNEPPSVSVIAGGFIVCPPQVIQEYERAVIFRLGRIAKGGARGPGMYQINVY